MLSNTDGENRQGQGNAIQHVPLNRQQIDAVLQDWREQYPNAGVLALLPEAEKNALSLLQDCCRRHQLALSGAIFPALLVGDEFCEKGVLLLRFDERIPSVLIPDLNDGKSPAHKKIVDALQPALEQYDAQFSKPSLYMMFDGLLPNIATILDGLYVRLSDRVSYAGVNAGSESFQAMPCLFDADQLIEGGALCLLAPGQNITVLEHGYPVPRHVMNASSTEGNRIISIDWRPAFEVYQDIINQEYGINLTPENFYQYAVHFPFGMLRANQDVVVRIPVAIQDDGSLFCIGEVSENAILVLLRAPDSKTGQCVGQLATGLRQSNGSLQGRGLLTFYCAGRRMHLGDEARQELTALMAQTGVSRMVGALSLGEIGSISEWDYPMFHNATLVCTPWGTA